MKRKLFTIWICLSSWLLSAAYGQEARDLDLMGALYQVEEHEPHYRDYARGSDNEFKLIASGVFLLYKTFISSQDYNRCSFAISCSEYAMLCVKRYGFARGILMGLDRYTRCNGLHHDFYEMDPEKRLLHDPVEAEAN